MILYVNGDSHSWGDDAGGPEFSYGRHLADHYSAEFICDAKSAASNSRILRTTREYLKSNIPDLLIIGWSTWEREEWYADGKFWQVNAGGIGFDWPVEIVEKYKPWVIDVVTRWDEKEKEAHDTIWEFHQELTQKKIRHLFFNCYSWFMYINAYNRQRYDWGDCYIDPYNKDQTYYFWLENQGFKPSNPEFYHYGPDAHVAWSNYLLTKIPKESIITT